MVDSGGFALLVRHHLGGLAPERAQEVADRASRLYENARAAWPEIDLEPEAFAHDLAGRLRRCEDVAAYFDALQAEDFYLACACAHGLDVAIAAFERTYARDLEKIARRFSGQLHSAEDLGQAVREKLFVADSSRPPRIAEYSGFGFLQNWLRVTATRTCLDQVKGGAQRKRETPADSDEIARVADPIADLELDFLRREYRAEFKKSFREALASLAAAERNVLRQHLVHGLGIDQIAAIYHVHRATAARRLARAREALLQATRRELMAALSIDRAEFDSIMGLIRSRLSVSMHRLLEDDE